MHKGLILTIVTFSSLMLANCSHSDMGFEIRSQYENAGSCVSDPEMKITHEENVLVKSLDIVICYPNEKEVIFLTVGQRHYSYETGLHIGARVRFEYNFGKNRDLFLVTYGYDNASIEYDYVFTKLAEDNHSGLGSQKRNLI